MALFVILLLCLCVFITGCGSGSGGKPESYALIVKRVNVSIDEHRYTPREWDINNAANADRLYTALQNLPKVQGAYSCAMDTGLEYRLTFALKNSAAQPITVSASGCRTATLDKADIRLTNEDFWSLFASTLGISKGDMFPPPSW